MSEVNTSYSYLDSAVIDFLEQGEHIVAVGRWQGVASHVNDSEGVEGTVIWVPGVKISDLPRAK